MSHPVNIAPLRHGHALTVLLEVFSRLYASLHFSSKKPPKKQIVSPPPTPLTNVLCFSQSKTTAINEGPDYLDHRIYGAFIKLTRRFFSSTFQI